MLTLLLLIIPLVGTLILLGWGPVTEKSITVLGTSIYYQVITIATSRYTLFFLGILLSFVMSIYIHSPVYCEDGPTQAVAATATEHKSSISTTAAAISQKSEASTTAPIFKDPAAMNFQEKARTRAYGTIVGGIVTGGLLLGNVIIEKHFPTGFQMKTAFSTGIANTGARLASITIATGSVALLYNGVIEGTAAYDTYSTSNKAQYGRNIDSNLTTSSQQQAEAIKAINQSSDAAISKRLETTAPDTNLLNKDYLQSKFRADSAVASSPNTITNTDSVSGSYTIPCILEERESTTFVQSCKNFVVDWLNSEYGSRVPGNLSGNLLDYFTFDFSFASLNLIIIFMHSLVYWLLFFLFTLVSLNYFSSKRASWLNKAKNSAAVIKVFIYTNILVVVFLFLVILIFSAYIYFYCNIPEGVALHINNTMKILKDQTTDITITNSFMGAPSHYYMKTSGTVALCILGIYRTYVVIRPMTMHLTKTITSSFIVLVIVTVNLTQKLLTQTTTMTDNAETITLFEHFARYNECNHVLFYSMIIIIVSLIIVTILTHYKKNMIVTDNDQCNPENNKIRYSKKFLIYEILVAYNKVITSMALYCAFQSIVFLHVYSLPGDLDCYLTLY